MSNVIAASARFSFRQTVAFWSDPNAKAAGKLSQSLFHAKVKVFDLRQDFLHIEVFLYVFPRFSDEFARMDRSNRLR